MKTTVFIMTCAWLVGSAALAAETLNIKVGGQDLITYQAQPMSQPVGGDKFKGSNFIHPLKTPSGFTVTELQPKDHLHHFGVWWPWKHVEVQGRKILFWELQKGDGIIQAQGAQATEGGFTSTSVYLDRQAPAGAPSIILKERVNAKASEIVNEPARGYFLDLEIIHQSAVATPIAATPYRYSGFAIRGAAFWRHHNSTLLTDAGKDHGVSNFTRARWVRLQGKTDADGMAGVLLMSHPGNYDYPETLRTWNPKTHDGAFFINFNSVYEKPWVFEPGQTYTRRYRLFVYDGELSAEQANTLHAQYASSAAK